MDKKIYQFFKNKQNSIYLAQEISETFINTANKENIEYSFDIAKETGKVLNKKANTFFSFDPAPFTLCHKLKNLLYDEDLKDLTKEEDQKLVEDTALFLEIVAVKILDTYIDQIRNTLRAVVLPSSKKEDIPLSEIEILSIEVTNYYSIPESSKHLVKIGKKPPKLRTKEVDTEKVISYLYIKQEETGKTMEEIFKEEYNTNPLFEEVLSIETGKKYLYEFVITFFVNYSLAKMPIKL